MKNELMIINKMLIESGIFRYSIDYEDSKYQKCIVVTVTAPIIDEYVFEVFDKIVAEINCNDHTWMDMLILPNDATRKYPTLLLHFD